MKRYLFRIIILVTFIALFCCAPSARAETDGDFEYSINPDGVTCKITGYTGEATTVNIPEYFGEYQVTIIESNS